MSKIYLSPTSEQEVDASNDSGVGRKYWKAQQKINERLETAEFKLTPSQIVLTVTSSDEYKNDKAQLQSQISVNATQIGLRATKSELNDLGDRVTTNEGQLVIQADLIASKVSTTDLTTTLTNYSTISQTSSAITTYVTANTYSKGAVDNKLTAYSTIEQTAEQISTRVATTDYNGNAIASMINQTATTIKLAASKLELSGYVTFNNLSSPGGTTIDGGNITTGTINANRVVAAYLSTGTVGGWTINGSTISRAGITLGNDYISLGNTGTTGSTINLGSAKIYNIGGGGVGISSYLTVGADISPQNDNRSALGSSYARFKEVWAVDGSINTSDVSDKKDIRTLTNGDAFDLIMQLNPVKFKWIGRNRNHYGFLAQDVKNILDLLNIDFGGYIDPAVNGQEGYKGLRYTEFIAPLVYTVQVLNTRLEELRNEIKDLRALQF